MPNRLIKESICTSDNLDRLSWFEEVVFFRLIVNCDDYGRMDARPAILRARLFPLKSVTDKQLKDALQSLRSADMIDIYEVDGRSFLQIRTWEKHQQMRAKKSKYPAPADGVIASDCNLQADDINCMQMISNVPVIQSESESNPNTKRARFTPPTVEEVAAYCEERRNGIDAQEFVDHYAANGWMRGKSQVKDWQACVRTWEKNRRSSPVSAKPGGVYSFDDVYERF